MNILVLGWYYSSNLGDAVICECTVQLLRQRFPGANIKTADLCGRRDFPPRCSEDLRQITRLRCRQKLRSAATCLGWDKQLCHEQWCLDQHARDLDAVTEGIWDLAVFAGGQLFMDDIALYVIYHTRRLQDRKIPVIFNACGIGPMRSPHIRRELARTLQLPNVKLVSCRDGCAFIDRICGKALAVPTADPALWTGECSGIEAHSTGIVGLGVLCPRNLDPGKTTGFWHRIIRELDRRQIPWKFFTNGKEMDMAFARTLLAGRREEDFLCPPPETPEQLVTLIGSFRSILGFRLHSHIIAASLGVPTAAVTWDPKVPGFFRAMGMEDRCFRIRDRADHVVEGLLEAERDPLSREAVLRCRNQARGLLLDTAEACLKGEL